METLVYIFSTLIRQIETFAPEQLSKNNLIL